MVIFLRYVLLRIGARKDSSLVLARDISTRRGSRMKDRA